MSTTTIRPKINEHDVIPLTFLNLVVQSAFIPDTVPLSTLIIAKAGHGKTIKLEYLRKFKWIYYTVDMTPKHLIQFFDKVKNGEKRFLVIPDYITTLAHSQKTKDLFRGHLRAMMEEGVKDSDAYGVEYHFDKKLNAGLISGITPEYFNNSSRVWQSDGFLSRFLPFSYSHSSASLTKIMDNIRDRIKNIDDFKMIVRTGRKAFVPTRTTEQDANMRLIAYSLLPKADDSPIRMYKQVITLCNANSVIRDSRKIEEVDLQLIRDLGKFINRKQTMI